jgi:hypothetical protein
MKIGWNNPAGVKKIRNLFMESKKECMRRDSEEGIF